MSTLVPIWAHWTTLLPRYPRACDSFENGMYRMPRCEALKKKYLEFNPSSLVNFVVLDVDHEDSFEAWEVAKLPPPNFFVQNRVDGRGHLYYVLEVGVGLSDRHHAKPMAYLDAVRRGLTRRLKADRAFTNRFAKNPLHPDFRASWLSPAPFSLGDLRECLDLEETSPFPSRGDASTSGRNCTLFERLSSHAYSRVLERKAAGWTLDQWRAELLRVALGFNAEFPAPLPLSEVRATAKSVARWTWSNFTAEKRSKIQSLRARLPRGAQLTAQQVTAARLDGGSAAAIAMRLGTSERTVRRYGAVPRTEFEQNGKEHTKPWLLAGISRATFFRRRKLKKGDD